MKPTDLTVILKGLRIVARTLIRVNQKEIETIWKNSSISTASKSVLNRLEENLSSLAFSTGKENPIVRIANEMKERGSMVSESIKRYAAYVTKQDKVDSEHETLSNFSIEHPIIQENISSADFNITCKSKDNPSFKSSLKLEELNSQDVINSSHVVPEVSVSSASSEKLQNLNSIGLNSKQHKQSIKVPDTFVSSDLSALPRMETVSILSEQKIQKSHKLQKLSDRARERKVPSNPLSRLLAYGGLAVGMSIDTLAEVAKRKLDFKSDKESDAQSLVSENLFLNEASANRIVDTLCKVRGAALKLGQMLSIQDNAMINPQLAAVFERVRQSADFMPVWQMERVLCKELGNDWQTKFSEFNSKPFAAASIGQVHRAKLLDNTEVALKVQYPGVAQSIESDIKSLMAIINLWNILPDGLFLNNVMSVAKRELKREVDYIHEAKSGRKFKKLLETEPVFFIPEVFEDLCTSNVLTTELAYGIPIDKLQDDDQALKNKVCENLLRLCLKEIFLFRFMQTDPNWSNFLYNSDTKQIVLLDFGACNEYTPQFVDIYVNIIKAASDQDRESVLRFSQELGFLTGYESKVMEEAHVDAVMILGEAFAHRKPFNFKEQNMTHRIHNLVPIMLKHRLTPPPEETYSLHRKISGIFLLCTKLGAVINCNELFDDIYQQYLMKSV